LEKSVALKADNPPALKALSNAYYQKGNKKKAVETAERLSALLPNDAEQQTYLAVMYESDGRTAEAEKLYRAVISKDGKQVVALNNLAAMMTKAGKLDEAVSFGKQAVALAPNEPHVLDTLAWA